MSTVTTAEAEAGQDGKPAEAVVPQSAAAPSPFPPIAEYAFLSNCHTGALVAPDGSIDWLCVPRFDSPSVFGSLLDREAGTFRLGPFGINVPTARIYEPGTNVLVTTWKTPTGWVVVRDALTMGPRQHEDDDHAAHPAAGRRRRAITCWCAPSLCLGGQCRDRARVRAGLRLRARAGAVVARRRRTVTPPTRPAPVRRCGSRPTWRSASRANGSGPAHAASRASRSTARSRGRRTSRRRQTSTRPTRVWPPPRASGAPGWTGPGSRPPLARPDPALGARRSRA